MRKIIINATNIGSNLSGISRGTLSILEEFNNIFETFDYRHLKTQVEIIANSSAKKYLNRFKNLQIKYISSVVSPDNGFKGHLFRLLVTNYLGLKYKNAVIFNTSQLEGQIVLLFKRNFIITLIYDLIPLIYKFPKQYFYFKYILPFVIRNSAFILTVSQYTKNMLVSKYNISEDKIVVVPMAASKIFKRLKNFQKENFILYVGRFHKLKNIQGILDAFSILRDRYKLDYKLILVGSGNINSFLLNRQSVIRYIEIYENISDFKLVELYNKASLFVFPSLYEGFGFPPLEAMACGCPVIVSNVASLPEVCGDAAYYVDPYDVESTADGMYKILTDKALRENLIKNGLERVKQFSWEKTAREILKIIESLL